MAVSAASILGSLVTKYAVLGFTEARPELNSLHDLSQWSSMLAIWAAGVAVVQTGIGVLRRRVPSQI